MILLGAMSACSTSTASTAKTGETAADKTSTGTASGDPAADERSKGSTIEIQANSPADTVRVFYKDLREKKFRDAMYLTNMRPAMEGLTDAELKEFQMDFNDVVDRVPQEIEINGEVISADKAVVTANLPGDDPDLLEIQQIKLRRDNGVWVILTVDEATETMIKKEGKNYFYALKIDTHENEARKMIQKIADVQTAMAAQNNGNYMDLQALVAKNLLPAEMQSGDSGGYKYNITLTNDGKNYYATATPAEYGKSGKSSFLLEIDSKKGPRITNRDTGGHVMKK